MATKGRPIQGAERKRRVNVMIEPRVIRRLRAIGKGNLSAGIAKAAEEYGK